MSIIRHGEDSIVILAQTSLVLVGCLVWFGFFGCYHPKAKMDCLEQLVQLQ